MVDRGQSETLECGALSSWGQSGGEDGSMTPPRGLSGHQVWLQAPKPSFVAAAKRQITSLTKATLPRSAGYTGHISISRSKTPRVSLI